MVEREREGERERGREGLKKKAGVGDCDLEQTLLDFWWSN
jgi:hypothetical protein